jgi:hypothetical protein
MRALIYVLAGVLFMISPRRNGRPDFTGALGLSYFLAVGLRCFWSPTMIPRLIISFLEYPPCRILC